MQKTSASLDEVAEIFAVWDACGVQYCILRGADELLRVEAFKEIDVLVAPESAVALAALLNEQGFCELPAWGHAPHRFFLNFVPGYDCWLKFDLVTALRYGRPIRALPVDLAKDCLQRRRRQEATWVLAPEHEFCTLLLHILLDKGAIKAGYPERLQALLQALEADAAVGARARESVKRIMAPALGWREIAAKITDRAADDLLGRSRRLARQLFLRNPFRSSQAFLGNFFLQKMRPALFMLRRRGMFIALLAADGAGKSTLACALARDRGLRARLIYMGTNVEASTVGLPASKWLHRQVKKQRNNRRAKWPGARLIRALNFCNRLAETWYRLLLARYYARRGKFVVFDRYVYDSWLVQRPATPWKRIRRWLFESGYPQPDLVIFLDAPGDVLYARKGEHSPDWLETQRQGYLALRRRIPRMAIVDATRNEIEVQRQVKSLIWKHYTHCTTDKVRHGLRYSYSATNGR